MVCFFVGHRDVGGNVLPGVEQEVERHIAELGVTEFVVGQYGAFDRMAARAVIDARKRHARIRLTVLLPYHPSERAVCAPEYYDDTFYPPGMETVPHRFAIIRANQYMIDHCDYLIAFVNRVGNAKKLIDYARRKPGITITNLAEHPFTAPPGTAPAP